MNLTKIAACGVLIILSTTAYSAGSIILRDKHKKPCEIEMPEPGKTATIALDNVPKCQGNFDNITRSFQLINVPSATTITFLDFTTCEFKAPWFRIKTIHKNTSTEELEPQNVITYSPGKIIRPGIQMEERLQGGHSFVDQLSCLIIKTSALPPASSPAPVTAP